MSAITPDEGFAIAEALHERMPEGREWVLLVIGPDGDVSSVASVPPGVALEVLRNVVDAATPEPLEPAVGSRH